KVARRTIHLSDGAGWRRNRALDRGKWPVEPLEDSIESHAHLVSQRPTRIVVWRSRSCPGIGKVVRMVLRLEHVENVRAERLRRFHDKRSRRVGLPANLKRRRCPLYGDAVPDQRVHELYRGQK